MHVREEDPMQLHARGPERAINEISGFFKAYLSHRNIIVKLKLHLRVLIIYFINIYLRYSLINIDWITLLPGWINTLLILTGNPALKQPSHT